MQSWLFLDHSTRVLAPTFKWYGRPYRATLFPTHSQIHKLFTTEVSARPPAAPLPPATPSTPSTHLAAQPKLTSAVKHGLVEALPGPRCSQLLGSLGTSCCRKYTRVLYLSRRCHTPRGALACALKSTGSTGQLRHRLLLQLSPRHTPPKTESWDWPGLTPAQDTNNLSKHLPGKCLGSCSLQPAL